jgi:hypothetical protein
MRLTSPSGIMDVANPWRKAVGKEEEAPMSSVEENNKALVPRFNE